MGVGGALRILFVKNMFPLQKCLKATAIRGGKPEKGLKVPLPASGPLAGPALSIGEKPESPREAQALGLRQYLGPKTPASYIGALLMGYLKVLAFSGPCVRPRLAF